jgi:signal transduction histidine kinase
MADAVAMFSQQGAEAHARRQEAPAVIDPPAPGSILGGLGPVIDGLPEAILVTDRSGAVRLANGAADRLFAEQPVRSESDLLSRLEPVPLAEGGTHDRTVRPRSQPNTWYELDRTRLDEPHGGGSLFVLRDVSFTQDLDAEREVFLSVITHELRTPLTTIYAGSSVLARRPSLSHPATRTLAMDISLEAARLYDIVENLLLIARLERRILDPIDEPVDLRRVVGAAVRLTTERFPGLRVTDQPSPPVPLVHGDSTYVEQAVRNLILAFVRGAQPSSEIDLTARLDVDPSGTEVAVRVFDEAWTLSQEELGLAFELPSTSTTGRLAVIGLELFVVRHAVEAMGGRAWALNRPDGGLEVGFALRTQPSVAEDESAAEEPATA